MSQAGAIEEFSETFSGTGIRKKKWKAYPKYKDSGVEWIGGVPEHWKVLAIKRVAVVKRGASPRPIDDPIYFDDQGYWAWVRIADVTASEKFLITTTQKLSQLGASLSVKLTPGELFLSIAGSVGKPLITSIPCCIHDGFVYFYRFYQVVEYFYYLFSSGRLFSGLGKLGTQLNLNTDTVGAIKIPLPSLEDQKTISSFLDHQTAKIDALIEKKKKLIELLKEKRMALISHAVTKGLDPNVKMKDSGVEWLGEVPEHWRVKKLKYIANQIVRKANEEECSRTYVGLENIEPWTGRYLESADQEKIDGDSILFEENNVLFGKLRPYLAKCWIAEFCGRCSGEAMVFRPREVSSGFLRSTLCSVGFVSIVNASTYGAKMPRANPDFVKNCFLSLPDMEEQKAISSFLDIETAKIDQLISKIESANEKLLEYRTALISAAVTGKIDVRDWKAP